MDWLQGLLEEHGATVLGVVAGLIVFVSVVALTDGVRHRRKDGPRNP